MRQKGWSTLISKSIFVTDGYLSAQQASQRLGVSLSTLYAYVSRGLIRSEPDKVKRQRRYRAEDVDLLLARKAERQGSGDRLLGEALHWGEPVTESELTLIQEGRLFYRGRDACGLAREATFEQVAELLWGGYRAALCPEWPTPLTRLMEDQEPLARFGLLLTWLNQNDRNAYDLRPNSVAETGSRILAALFASICAAEPGEPLAQALARAWAPGSRSHLEAALILCADHELNVSAFTARCVASAGATPYQVVVAGLAALSGYRHGGHSYRVEALFREAEALGPEGAIRSYLRQGAPVPGFGHKLYPQGDPRGREILAGLSTLPAVIQGLVEAGESILGEFPNLDFALVALVKTLSLPPGAHLGLFALGRSLGWLGHAIEQYQNNRLIRPRARYVGPLP